MVATATNNQAPALSGQRGITIIEVIVVMAIIAVASTLSLNFFSLDRGGKFDAQVQNMLAELRGVQQQARVVDSNKEYGMSFTATSWTTFSRDPQTGGTTNIQTRQLSNATLNANLVPAGNSLYFSRLSGLPASGSSATLTLSSINPTRQKIIRIESSGVMYVQ